MRIETMKPDAPVHVKPSSRAVDLGIGEPGGSGWRDTTLSLAQAEMVLHAIGLAIARIKEDQRLADEERARTAQVVLDTEVRLHQ